MDAIVIETRHLTLRTFATSDADDLFACISPAITRFMPWEPPISPAAFAAVWQPWLSSIRDGTEHYLVVRLTAGNRCLGVVGLHALQTNCPELGIWLRADSHGQGFGKEAISSVLSWASDKLRSDYFEYPVAVENVASRRIAESLNGSIVEHRSNRKYNAVVYRIPNCAQRPARYDAPPS